MTQSDTGVTQDNGNISGKPSLEGYKHFKTAFFRDRANLKNGNGDDTTVCRRIDTAFIGILYHISVTDDAEKYRLKLQMLEFSEVDRAVHHSKYPGKPHEKTPMRVYFDNFNRLWQIVNIEEPAIL